MPKAYFEPENMSALADVFAEAKTRLNRRDVNEPAVLELVAVRILYLAAEGLSPRTILCEIAQEVETPATLQENESPSNDLPTP